MSDTTLRSAISAAEAAGWRLDGVHDDSRATLKRPTYGTVEIHVALGVLTFWTLGLVNALYAYGQYKLRTPVWSIRVDPTEPYTGPSPQLRELRAKIKALRADGWVLTRQISDRRAMMVTQSYGGKSAHLVVFALTFWSWGLGNCVYALYCCHATRRTRTLRVETAVNPAGSSI